MNLRQKRQTMTMKKKVPMSKINSTRFFFSFTATILFLNVIVFSVTQKSDSSYYQKNPVYQFETSMYKLNKLRNPDIVMFGDSHIQSARWNELLGNYKVINRGIAGDVTEGMKNRLTGIIKLHPKIVIFEGGINDVYNWVNPKLILNNIEYIIKTLKHNKINVIVNSIFLSGKYWGKDWIKRNHPEIDIVKYNFERNKVVKNINKSLQKLCSENGAFFLDLNKRLEKNGFLNERFSRDYLHLNAKGYEIWARELNKILRKIDER